MTEPNADSVSNPDGSNPDGQTPPEGSGPPESNGTPDGNQAPESTAPTRPRRRALPAGVTLGSLWSSVRHSRLAGAILVFVLGVVSLGAWAMSSPSGSEPDSDFHLASIWCTTAEPGSPCDLEERRNRKMVPTALIEARCFSQDPDASAACQPLMTTADDRETMTNRLNIVESKANYPTGFFLSYNQFADSNVDTSVFTMRMVGATLFVGLNVLLWWLLPIRLKSPLAWAWMATLIPLGMFIIPSTNPSSWSLIGVGSAWIALLGYLESTNYRKWILGSMFLVFVLLAVASRTDATLFAIATAGLAIFVTDAPFRQLVKRLWIPAVGALAAVGWLFVQGGAIGVLTEGIGSDGEPFDWQLLWHNFIEVPGLWMGSFGIWPWGSLGWLDTPMPQLVAFLSFGVFIALLGLGITGSTWRVRAVTFVILAMMWVYPLFILQQAGFLVGAGFQSRYGLPLLVVLLGVAVLRSEGTPGIIQKFSQRAWIAGALAIANSVALHHNIRRYTTGLDERGFDLNAGREWWWFGLRESAITPMSVWLIGSIAFAAVAWIVVVYATKASDQALRLHSQDRPVADEQVTAQPSPLAR
ncbi:DUF2142 domain-containing protein [Pontimonas sp.]|uniref:DUF2142 domain-containing protein n=1 Tax=Pontimonas sp. TaxID=2304492 RepID=UPI0028706FD4|nr:DUF2142 domain-containing protein [Pontimonas sp.]MDR9396711.1 DUF2142 domain-containing protein [Pontimonas sp.]MDR9435116.1 DUF2142 domain-containing protein [Pontimonas sp.]